MFQLAPNVAALFLGTLAVRYLAFGPLWRIGRWQVFPAASLRPDEGVRIGPRIPTDEPLRQAYLVDSRSPSTSQKGVSHP